MGIFDCIRIDPTPLRPLTEKAPARILTKFLEVPPAQAIVWAIGASIQSRCITGIRPGKDGDVFCAWPLWWVGAQRAIVLVKVDRPGLETSYLSGWDSLLFDNCSEIPLPKRKSREYQWEVNARMALRTEALANGKPILNGRFRTTYLWLE